jgi:hypothetical protein
MSAARGMSNVVVDVLSTLGNALTCGDTSGEEFVGIGSPAPAELTTD